MSKNPYITRESVERSLNKNPEQYNRKPSDYYYFIDDENNAQYNSAKLLKDLTENTNITGRIANKLLKEIGFDVFYVPKVNLTELSKNNDFRAIIKRLITTNMYAYRGEKGYYLEVGGKKYKTQEIVNEAVREFFQNNEKQKIGPIDATNLLRDLGFEANEPDSNTQNVSLNDTRDDKCIILNKMFVGNYLDIGENIGHEIINLYEADDGNVYVYLNSMGTIKEKKLCKTMTVLMVKKYSLPNVLQVIAKVGIKDVVNGSTYENVKVGIECQNSELNLKYGKVSAAQIMANNRLPNRDGSNILATFLVDKDSIGIPKNDILIKERREDNNTNEQNESMFHYIDANLPKTSLRSYFYETTDSDAYKQLNKIIENDDLWEKDLTKSGFFQEVEIVKEIIQKTDNLLRISGNEDDELSFSNMLQYFLSDESLCREFLKEMLESFVDSNFSVAREEYDIDLLVRGDKSLVVIENKIHSGINGKFTMREDNSKEKKWIEECFVDNEGDELESIEAIYDEVDKAEGDPSQLEKYYVYAKARSEIEKKEKIFFLILCPKYSKNFLKNGKDNLKFGDKYEIKTYEDLYIFFKAYYDRNKNQPNSVNMFYLNEFIKALEKHTLEVDNYREKEMDRRFKNQIFKLRQNII